MQCYGVKKTKEQLDIIGAKTREQAIRAEIARQQIKEKAREFLTQSSNEELMKLRCEVDRLGKALHEKDEEIIRLSFLASQQEKLFESELDILRKELVIEKEYNNILQPTIFYSLDSSIKVLNDLRQC